MLLPNSGLRTAWEVLLCPFVGYECVVIPLQVVLPENGPPEVVVSIARIFWLLDLSLCFFTGYLDKEGRTEMRPWMVSKNYLMKWFHLDVVMLLLDWVELLVKVAVVGDCISAPSCKLMSRLKLLRILRICS